MIPDELYLAHAELLGFVTDIRFVPADLHIYTLVCPGRLILVPTRVDKHYAGDETREHRCLQVQRL